MTARRYVDRSRVQTFQRCPRQRYLEYSQDGTGIVPVATSLPLAVGKSVHAGLADILASFVGSGRGWIASEEAALNSTVTMRALEDHAVSVALAEFHANTIELDVTEASAIPKVNPEFLEMKTPGGAIDKLEEMLGHGKSEFYRYLAAEQAALTEGEVRAYARRPLRPLLEQFEVLEVEREGEWLLADVHNKMDFYSTNPGNEFHREVGHEYELWFMSRPDALLRERSTNQLYLLSFKTAASWDVRKARDAEHDMQGLSEGVEVERRLAEWWEVCRHSNDIYPADGPSHGLSVRMFDYLRALDAPPRIHAIRYEYLLKGDRWKDRDLTARFGFEARAQRSPLVRGYLNAGMAVGDEQWCHSWDYLKDGGTGETSKLNYRAWRSEPVWTHMPIARWIDMLESATMTVAESGGELGYSCEAQAVGYTATHPLDDVFVPPIIVYRSDDSLRDWIETTEAQERRIAEALVRIDGAADEDSRRSLLNVNFGQHLRACSYPTECVYVPVCFGGDDIRRDPLGSGRYKRRVANHPQEVEK